MNQLVAILDSEEARIEAMREIINSNGHYPVDQPNVVGYSNAVNIRAAMPMMQPSMLILSADIKTNPNGVELAYFLRTAMLRGSEEKPYSDFKKLPIILTSVEENYSGGTTNDDEDHLDARFKGKPLVEVAAALDAKFWDCKDILQLREMVADGLRYVK